MCFSVRAISTGPVILLSLKALDMKSIPMGLRYLSITSSSVHSAKYKEKQQWICVLAYRIYLPSTSIGSISRTNSSTSLRLARGCVVTTASSAIFQFGTISAPAAAGYNTGIVCRPVRCSLVALGLQRPCKCSIYFHSHHRNRTPLRNVVSSHGQPLMSCYILNSARILHYITSQLAMRWVVILLYCPCHVSESKLSNESL